MTAPFDSTKSSGRTNVASNSTVAAKDAGIACSCSHFSWMAFSSPESYL